jgi:hypothetical protein
VESKEFREIIHSHRFVVDMASIEADPVKADEYLEGLEWVLSRDPLAESEPIADAEGVYITYIKRIDELKPPIAIYFLFDDNSVELLGASVDEDAEWA